MALNPVAITNELGDCAIGNLLDIKRFGERYRNQIRLGDGRQPNKLNSACEIGGTLRCYGDGQPGFSRASGAGKAYQPNIWSKQELGGLRHFPFSADERSAGVGRLTRLLRRLPMPDLRFLPAFEWRRSPS